MIIITDVTGRTYNRMFILRRVYIISDDQFFALGIASLFYMVNANIIRPEDIFNKKQVIEEGVCYLYIKNRKLHQQLCHYFRCMPCKFIFFLPNAHCDIEAKFRYYFWSAKIDLHSLMKRTAQVSLYYNYNVHFTLTSAAQRSMELISQGVETYVTRIKASNKDAKVVHRHYRAVIKSVGIESVSVHNLFLTEYIAVSHMLMVWLSSRTERTIFRNLKQQKIVNAGLIHSV